MNPKIKLTPEQEKRVRATALRYGISVRDARNWMMRDIIRHKITINTNTIQKKKTR